RQEGLDPAPYVLRAIGKFFPSSGVVRGADGTRNKTWELLKIVDGGHYQAAPCSVGAMVEGGFVTAGHCMEPGDEIAVATTGYVHDTSTSSPYFHPYLIAEPTEADYETIG